MFPARCDYVRAGSVQEAIDLLGRHEEAKILAGGHSLIPMMKLRLARPSLLVDIGRLAELRGIERDGDRLLLGALTPHARIAASEEVRAGCPVLAEAAASIGDPQVRNKGTIGGNIAHADPASDLPGVLVALEAEVHLLGPDGERRVNAGDFFVGLMTTDLGPGEVITRVAVPVLGSDSGSAYLKVEHPASGYAVCGAAAVVQVETDGSCSRASLAFNGVAEVPLRADGVAMALAGARILDAATIDAAVEEHLEIQDALSDLYASGAYRRALARAYGKRALELARKRAG